MNRCIWLVSLLIASNIGICAQNKTSNFEGYFFNDEYNVYIRMNLHSNNIIVPGHEMFGSLPGYLGKKNNNFFWLITSGKIIECDKSEFDLVNDYGSEDLKVSFIKKNDSIYILRQESGNSLKVPNNRKWQKLPKEMEFKKK